MDDEVVRCLRCPARPMRGLRHCLQHASIHGSPVRSCSQCSLPCVQPASLCVLHGLREAPLLPFDEAVLDALASERLDSLHVAHGAAVVRAPLRAYEDDAQRNGARDPPRSTEWGSATLHALLAGGSSAQLPRSTQIDMMVRLLEAQVARARDTLRHLQDASVRSESAELPTELASLASVEAGTSNVVCRAPGCQSEPLVGGTPFCLAHILSDPRQKLFKACSVCQAPVFAHSVTGLCMAHRGEGATKRARIDNQ